MNETTAMVNERTTRPCLLVSAGPPGSPTLSTISFDGERFAVATGAQTTMIEVTDVVDHLLTALNADSAASALVVVVAESDDARVVIAAHRSASNGWADAPTGAPLTEDDLRAEVLSLLTLLMSTSQVASDRAVAGPDAVGHGKAPRGEAS